MINEEIAEGLDRARRMVPVGMALNDFLRLSGLNGKDIIHLLLAHVVMVARQAEEKGIILSPTGRTWKESLKDAIDILFDTQVPPGAAGAVLKTLEDTK